MSRRGAGVARRMDATAAEREPELELMEVPALGALVGDTARELIARGMRAPEVSSLMAHAAAQLAQQGPNRLTRDEWLTLCAVLWDGPDGSDLVTAPGGDA